MKYGFDLHFQILQQEYYQIGINRYIGYIGTKDIHPEDCIVIRHSSMV